MAPACLARDGNALALFTFVHDDTRLTEATSLFHACIAAQHHTSKFCLETTKQRSQAFAKSVGLPEASAHGGLIPRSKRSSGFADDRQTHVTMMVGDGFNDAAALAVADVGVAVGSGETVNLEAADVLVPGDDPQMLTELIDLVPSGSERILIGNLRDQLWASPSALVGGGHRLRCTMSCGWVFSFTRRRSFS